MISEEELLGTSGEEETYYCVNLHIKDLDTERANFCTFYSPKSRGELRRDKEELLELKRELLLEMSEEKLAQKYEISAGYVSMLKSALKEGRFEILVRNDLSSTEISKKLDISESSVRAYLTALKKVGISPL